MTALHVIGIPWTQINHTFSKCAYSMKILKFCKMMQNEGFTVHLYAGQHSEVPEGVVAHTVITDVEQRVWFGEWDPNDLFSTINWDSNHPSWKALNERTIREINKVSQPRDIVCITSGRANKPVYDALNHKLTFCESGVGYEGIFTDRCAFESYAWMHYLYGKAGINDGRWFDTVIPNYFDVDDFVTQKKPGDYLLFIGRLVQRKGPHVAAQIAQELDIPLLVAGPGATSWEKGKIVCPEITIEGSTVEYVGPVGVKERADLMAGARALLAPTSYIGPFEGVTVEGMFCGTPAVTTNWGVFAETVKEGVSGYRFNSLAGGCDAVEAALKLDRAKVKRYAKTHYSLEAVGPQFTRWFEHLDTLWEKGWYQPRNK